jgi:hypothetical protein
MTASINETVEATSATRHDPGLRTRPHQDADVTDLDRVRVDRLAAARQRRAAAHTRDLTALLRERPDLVGVHPPADFTVDSLPWCV